MPLYQTTLIRYYAVTIEAEDEKIAASLAEFFICDEDFSSIEDREKFKFEIRKEFHQTEVRRLSTQLRSSGLLSRL